MEPMSPTADNRVKLGTYDLVVGPAGSPLGETWIARAEVPSGLASDLVTLRRFGADDALSLQELEVLSEAADWALSVKQEGVVPTTELVVDGRQLAWVRPYVLGEPLRRLLQHSASKRQAPSVEVALRIVVDVLEAAVAMAARPHRLFSGALLNCCLLGPDVVWISSDGRSRITDVGVLGAAGSLDRFAKHPDLAAYRAPEQMGGFLAEPRSDVFVAGILLWELLSGGRRLFEGGELATVVGAVFASPVEEPRTPTSTNRPEAGAAAVVMRALDRDPTRRFQSPREMLQAIHDLGPGAVAKRESVAEYLTTVSNHPLSREREVLAQLLAGARLPQPSTQEPSAAAADTRPSRAPLERGTDQGHQPARASSPPGAGKADGTAAERVAWSSRPSAKKPEAAQVQSPRRSGPVPANKTQSAGSQPTEAASRSSATGRTSAAGSPAAAASQRPSARPNAATLRANSERVLALGIKPVMVSPRPNATKALTPRSQPPASSTPPGPGRLARAVEPAAAPSSKAAPEEETLGTGKPAAGAEQPTDTKSDPNAAASPSAGEPPAAASGAATAAGCAPAPRDASAEPAGDETTPSSEPVHSMPILCISEGKQEDGDAREADKEPAAAHGASTPPVDQASTPPADEASSDARTASAPPTAEGGESSAAEAESTEGRSSGPEPAASEAEQGRSTWPGFAAETGAESEESEAAACGENREAVASGEKPSPPGPAAPAEGKEPDIAPEKAEAAVAAAPLEKPDVAPEKAVAAVTAAPLERPDVAPEKAVAAVAAAPLENPDLAPEKAVAAVAAAPLEKPDVAPEKAVAAVAAAPFLDEATTRALKPRFPLAAVMSAAAILAGGIYWLSGAGSASHERARPAQVAPQKRTSTAESAAAQAPAAESAAAQATASAAPELSSAAAPSEAAPTAAEDARPAEPEPPAEPATRKRPASQYVAGRAKPKPKARPEAGEPAKVTKSAGATKTHEKPAAGSATPKKASALDILRRLDKRN
jgi:serine/threonine protein kinase